MAKRYSHKFNSQEASKTTTGGKTSGFPSPAADYLAKSIDLNELLIQNPSSIFFAWLKDGDKEFMAIVDRSLTVVDGCKVVAWDEGQWYLKKLRITNGQFWLFAIKGDAKPIYVNADEPYTILGRLSKLIWINP